MKNILILIVSFVVFAAFTGREFSLRKEFKKNYAALYDGLYMSKYEVTNAEYRAFLEAQKAVMSATDLKLLEVDTTCFEKLNPLFKPFRHYYFTHKAYDNYPVVGISYDAANAYCNWLTEENKLETVKDKHIKFTLPSKAAWQYAGNSGDAAKQFTWGTGFTTNNRGRYLANFKHEGLSQIFTKIDSIDLTGKAYFTSPVNSFFPSSAGVFNLCGNVAEMLEEKGVAAGGSFVSEPFEMTLKSFKNFDKPSADIGFRVMAALY